MNGEDLVQSMLEGEILAHYGIKGQKWGIRHDQEKEYKQLKNVYIKDLKKIDWSDKNERADPLNNFEPTDDYFNESAESLINYVLNMDDEQAKKFEEHGRFLLNDKDNENFRKRIFAFRKSVRHKDAIDEEFLAHYGIKNQKWGVRRFQNEDGSLTPEGRERYGLKGGLSSMSDDDLRKAINRKTNENTYIRLQTKDATKRRTDISEFVKALGDTTKTATNPNLQKVYLSGLNKSIAEDNARLQTQKEAALKSGDKKTADEVSKIIAQNNKDKATIQNAINVTGKTAEEVGKQSTVVGKVLTAKEMQDAKDRAYRNIGEMDEKQLKSVVDRMLLEEQYQNLVNPPKPSKLEKGKEWLQTVGSILGIALSVVTIAGAIKGIKSGESAKHGEELADEYLAHYGVKGMKKGDRRWQNEDGSLTAEGYIHYGINRRDPNARVQEVKDDYRVKKQQIKSANKLSQLQNKQTIKEQRALNKEEQRAQKVANKEEMRVRREQIETRRKNIMKAVIGTAAVAGIAALGYNYIHQKNLDNKMLRDLELKKQEGKQILQQLNIEKKAEITMAKAKMMEAKGSVLEKLQSNSGTVIISEGKVTYGVNTAEKGKVVIKNVNRQKWWQKIGQFLS